MEYFKNDKDWDGKMLLGKIQRESNSVSEAVNRLVKCLENEKQAISDHGSTLEIIDEVPISDEIGARFAKAMNNLQNEVVYNSLFIICSSFIEFSLTEICRVIHPYLERTIVPYYQYGKEKGVRGKGMGIEKSKNYLTEALDINISQVAGWSVLKDNATIRNTIVHNGGNIFKEYAEPLEKQPEYQFFKQRQGIDLTETGYVFIENVEYIKSYHQTCVNFISQVYKLAIKSIS
jgi:hypothetical protein